VSWFASFSFNKLICQTGNIFSVRFVCQQRFSFFCVGKIFVGKKTQALWQVLVLCWLVRPDNVLGFTLDINIPFLF
jgi:hypothetical protein